MKSVSVFTVVLFLPGTVQTSHGMMILHLQGDVNFNHHHLQKPTPELLSRTFANKMDLVLTQSTSVVRMDMTNATTRWQLNLTTKREINIAPRTI